MPNAELESRPTGGQKLLGLTHDQVKARTSAGLHNHLPSGSSRSMWQILRANVFTLFNGIVVGGFLLLVVLGQWKDALFGLAAITNSVIGVIQEYRAKRLLDRLAIGATADARVLRHGTVHTIPVDAVVQDDVLIVSAGDQVPADAVIIDDDGLELDESLLTGESESVDKSEGDELLSGSLVVAGFGRARVTRVGAGSYSSRLTTEAKRFSLFNSEIRNSLNRLLGWISWSLLPITVIVVNGQMQAYGGWEVALTSGTWKNAAVGAIASITAMIPLGLVLISSVAFAVGGMKLATMNVLIQELPALEGLARVDMLCIDKTGTLTDGTMLFDGVHNTAVNPPRGWNHALGWFGAHPLANKTARCLATEFTANNHLEELSSIPFSSERKWSSVTFCSDSDAPGTWVMGAAEFVLAPASSNNEQTLRAAATLADAGLRTLLLAHSAELSAPDATPATPTLPDTLSPVTLLTFRESVRNDAAETIAYFQSEGVAITILSGDDPLTVAAVARHVGVHVDAGFDARELPEDAEELSEILAKNVVFGRVTPYQKRDIVKALQSSGHTVAMTGDGVNDALAMKEADIGIAMGSASAATKAVARLVLLDGRFDRLPFVVAEGRRVIANIERLARLFLTKTTYIILLSLVYGALLWEFPFLPRQISATDGLTIGIPALFLALMPNTQRYIPGFLRRSLAFAVPGGVIVAAALIAVGICVRMMQASTMEAQTAAVITLSLIGLWILVVLSRPLNAARIMIIASMYAGLVLVLVVPIVTDFFRLTWPAPDLLIACLIAAAFGCLGIEIMSRIHRVAQLKWLRSNN